MAAARKPRRWFTAQDDALILRRIDEGYTFRAIGDELSRTKCSIDGRAWRLGVARSKEQARALFGLGGEKRCLADRTGPLTAAERMARSRARRRADAARRALEVESRAAALSTARANRAYEAGQMRLLRREEERRAAARHLACTPTPPRPPARRFTAPYVPLDMRVKDPAAEGRAASRMRGAGGLSP